ncbi:hypothetical protein [Helicobacter sp. T3_23-1059]
MQNFKPQTKMLSNTPFNDLQTRTISQSKMQRTQNLTLKALCLCAFLTSANALYADNANKTAQNQHTPTTQSSAQNTDKIRDNQHKSHSHSDSHEYSHAHNLQDGHSHPHDFNADSSHSHAHNSHTNSHATHENHGDSHATKRDYLHTYELHEHEHSKQSDFASLSAKVGIFGKSSALASKSDNANKDNYAMLYSRLLLRATPFANAHNGLSGLQVGVGAVAYSPFYNDRANAYTYINSNFVANNAYLGYIKDFNRASVEVLAGRFEQELEWVGHSLQGVFGRVTLPFSTGTNPHSAQIYGIWVNEHADITREFSSDFDFYKHLYPKENLFAGGVNLSLALSQNTRFHIEPYAYYLTHFFSVYGSKFVLDIGFGGDFNGNVSGTKWRSKTIAHGAFLYSNYARIHAGHNHNEEGGEHNHNHEDGHGHLDTDNRGDTYFALLEQEFLYKDLLYFGLGFQHIGARVFELANIETTSRFEAHEGQGFGVIRPGALHSGSHTTNAYDAHTNTYYGFVGARFGAKRRFGLEIMGRDSTSSAKTQSAFSLGLRYEFAGGFEIGGLAVYMLDKHAHNGIPHTLNRSFGKAYMQWRF